MKPHAPLVRRSAEEQERLESMLRNIFEVRFRFHELIGLKVASFEPQSPRLSFQMRPDLIGSDLHGRLHGGVIATALDAVGGFAVVVALAEKHADESAEQMIHRFSRIITVDMRVDYLHQGVGDHFYADARVIRLGGRIASSQMELKNDAGLLIATGTAAYVIS